MLVHPLGRQVPKGTQPFLFRTSASAQPQPPGPTPAAAELAVAADLLARSADVADQIAMTHFRTTTLASHPKPDGSPVTVADLAIEQEVRRMLPAGFAFLGEETGFTSAPGPWTFVIDPIDGTASYINGGTGWACLLAALYRGSVVAALASAPARGERYQATVRESTTRNGQAVLVSSKNSLSGARFEFQSQRAFLASGLGSTPAELTSAFSLDAHFPGNTAAHLRVTTGRSDLAWSPDAPIWDIAALSLLVMQAGGAASDLSGKPIILRNPGARASFISSNGQLHQAALTAIRHLGPGVGGGANQGIAR